MHRQTDRHTHIPTREPKQFQETTSAARTWFKNANTTFQQLVNQLIGDLEGCGSYLDDIITYSDNWEQHLLQVFAL